ncbi:MAG: hypothetical protein CW716_08700, partial [Candidatus Bathyarchaeum sp.]
MLSFTKIQQKKNVLSCGRLTPLYSWENATQHTPTTTTEKTNIHMHTGERKQTPKQQPKHNPNQKTNPKHNQNHPHPTATTTTTKTKTTQTTG